MKNLLNDARHEILNLRRENEILRAKVEMIDLFASVLHTQPALRREGRAPDVAWALQKKIDELDALPKGVDTVVGKDGSFVGEPPITKGRDLG